MIPAETQLTIVRMEIERQTEFAKNNLNKSSQEEKKMLEEFIKDAEEISLLLSEYESRSGKLRKLKRAKVIIKLTKKVVGLKRKYKHINPILEKFGGKRGFDNG